MISITNLKKQYKKYTKEYNLFQKEIYYYLKSLKSLKNIDIHGISQRPNSTIKTWKSINKNYEKGKYKETNNIFDIKDISGIRITCHCESDLNQLETVIPNELIKTGHKFYPEPKKEPYEALHFIVQKKIKTQKYKLIACEIQIRTVLGDAWAIQSHKYVYKDNVPVSNTKISEALSAINKGLENLWDIIKNETVKIKREGKYV